MASSWRPRDESRADEMRTVRMSLPSGWRSIDNSASRTYISERWFRASDRLKQRRAQLDSITTLEYHTLLAVAGEACHGYAIREAIEFHLDGLREDGSPIPPPSSKVEYIEVAA